MKDKKLLLEHYADPLFVQYVQKVKSLRPDVPKWKEGKSIEEWIHKSGQQAGFDLAISMFDGDNDG